MKQKEIANHLKKADKIVFFHHVQPDGDSISSSYALMEAMRLKFPEKKLKWVAHKEFIKKRFWFLNIEFSNVIDIDDIDETWTGVIGDNCVFERIWGNEGYKKTGFKISFDHHQNDIDFDHDIFWKDSTLGASSVQSYQIVKNLEIDLTSRVGILLLYGIQTDTGNFQFSLADHRPLEAASELMKFIDNEDLDNMYKKSKIKTLKDLEIQGYILSNFKLEKGVAYLKLTDEIQRKMNLSPDSWNRVNTIANIEGSGAWVFFIEYKKEGYIRTEIRSNGLPVNKIATQFGGGGHIRAAGAKLKINWETTDKFISVIQEELSKYNN
ncbi:MAG: bifunctional oligoribonuclease/PAP phosphatase NrnA [Mycoplasmatales bacterium]|nr:bifunctional oligoribonuclease/PAP phosphatase NrnA [Mycoplasmatales bacterium]